MSFTAIPRSIVLVLAAAALAAAPVASAEPPPSLAQYVEVLPSAGGGTAGVDTMSKKLPAKVQAKLTAQGPGVATSLKIIATSGAYGAPTQKLGARPPARQEVASTVGATDSGHGRLAGLVVLLLLSTAAAGVFAVKQRGSSNRQRDDYEPRTFG
jgi:hypothetical protein